eukprot:210129_1
MARTKSTAKRNAGSAPRKKLATIGRKRKLDEDTEYDEIRAKRTKLNTNSNNTEYQDVSGTDDYRESDDDVLSNNIKSEMDMTLESAARIFDSSCSISHLLTFTKQLHSITEKNKAKLEELTYRKKAISSLRNAYQEEMKPQATVTHGGFTWRPSRFASHQKYFNEKIFHFVNTMVKALRNCKTRDYEDFVYYTTHWREYSLDIALKTRQPHEEYSKLLHDLLSQYISDMRDISTIISEYSHNGYRWYSLHALEQTDSDGEGWYGSTYSIIHSIAFEVDDYFRNNQYYKPSGKYCGGGRTITFSSLRDELKCKTLYNMSDEDLACFIVAVWNIELKSDLFNESEHRIVKMHQ